MALERRKAPPLVPGDGPTVQELMPGDVAIGRLGDQMKTLLGSCVSVILTDPRRTVGTMCHIVHVGRPNQSNLNNTAFGEVAMQRMFDQLIGVGIPPGRCEAFVYGGGNMFPQTFLTTHVGANNARWVLDYLQECGIHVIDASVGGSGYRKVAWTVGRTLPEVQTVESTMR